MAGDGNNSSRQISTATNNNAAAHPFRAAVLRGLAVVAPPLLTVVIFVWVIRTTDEYLLVPMTSLVREAVFLAKRGEIRTDLDPKSPMVGDKPYHRVGKTTFIPQEVYDTVIDDPGDPAPKTAQDFYRRYIDLTSPLLRPYLTIPLFLSVFVVVLFLLGRLMAAGMGRFFVHRFERGIHRLPLVRTVYSSVKQVSDFVLTEREIEYTRVVALEYPRKGVWSLGFVTGESMLDIRAAANEPILSVLMPTSPMPVTGFTITVRKSETIDLNITIDQAFQFIVSCGVVVPPQQLQQMQATAEALPEPSESDRSAEPAASG